MLVWKKIKIDDNNREVLSYLGEYVRSIIAGSCDINDEVKNILLNYPLVYVHTWINENDKQCFYVGETIDLVRRTKEHSEKVKERNTWQEDWIKGKNHVSYYFSAKEMSKSLVLDIEDVLINILGGSEDICLKNSRDNEQGRYCGKEFKSILLEEIWNVLKSDLTYLNKVNVSDYVANSSDNNIYRQDISEPLIFFEKTKLWGKIEDIKKDICQNVCGCSELLLEWPVIYVHVWKNEEKHIRVYVGETIDIASRTLQHLKDETIYYDLDALIYHEDDTNWHDSWKKAIKRGEAFMFVFGHEYMNVSVTRDIENHLIRYTNFIKTSVNGRGNPQKMYWNRNEMHPLFQKIVRVLEEKCNNNPDLEKLFVDKKEKFCSLDDMKKQSMFMASPFMPLEGQQDKAKEQIMDCIIARLKSDDKKHNLLIVSGEAGTGKTVLASSIFFALQESYSYIRTAFLVNHSELLNAYNVQNAVRETATGKTMNTIVSPAETVINNIKYSYLRSILQYFVKEKQKCIVSALAKDFETFKKEIGDISISNTFENMNDLISLNKKSTIHWENLKYLINKVKENNLEICDPTYDVVLVDEAHLLRISGDGGGIKEVQLPTILENSKVTILLTDSEQFTDSCEIWDEDICNNNLTDKYYSFLKDKVETGDFFVERIANLTHQFRMNCSDNTKNWLKALYTEGETVMKFPYENGIYEYKSPKESQGEYYIYEKDVEGNVIYTIGIVESKWTLCRKINEKKQLKNPSALLASFCWDNRNGKSDDETRLFDIPLSSGEIARLRWHSTGNGATKDETKIWTMDKSLVSKKDNKITYIDIGSFHDIQGFDLNYAGVILGKSLKLGKDNKINYKCSEGGRRGISKNTPQWKKIIRNEIGVLLSRGIEGVYIYIDDDKLRKAVIDAIRP